MAFLILLLISKLIFYEATAIYINDKSYEENSDINNYKNRILDEDIPERNVFNNTNYRLSSNIIPERYSINLDLSKVENYKLSIMHGEIYIDFRIIHPTNIIDFHIQRPYIQIHHYILVAQFKSKNKYVINDLVAKSYNPSSHIFVLHFVKELLRGKYTLGMQFKCNVDKTKSFFQTTYMTINGAKKWIAATRFQGIGARQIFPCWDEPALKAIFIISIKHYSNYTVMSNMPVHSVDPIMTNLNRTIFKATPTIPTHLVGFTIFDLNFIYSISDSEWLPFDLKFAQNILQIIKKELLAYTFVYELKQMQHVAIPNFPDNVITNWGLNFYRLSDIVYKKGKDPVMRKIEVARLIAWGMVQQLIGNTVSPSWWSSLWFNDGITMWLATDVLDKIFPDAQIMDLFAVEYEYESLHLDCGLFKPFTSKIISSSDINSLFSYPRYAKAFTILNKLRTLLFAYSSNLRRIDIFRHSLVRYFTSYRNRPTNLNDFYSAAKRAQDEFSTLDFLEFDILQQINDWITPLQYPVQKVKQYYKTPNKVTVLSENNLWISLTYNTNKKIFEQSTTFNNNTWQQTSNKSTKVVEFSLENYEKEMIENLLYQSLSDYHRVNYNVAIWDRIIHLLMKADFPNNQKKMKLSVLTRAKLIDDAFHFMVADQLNSDIFWKMSHYLVLMAETDYIVWYPMFKVFEYVSRILPLPIHFESKQIKNIQEDVKFLLRTYIVTTSSINFRKLPDDTLTNSLIQEITKWTCVFDFTECFSKANQYMIMHINNPAVNKILPWWKKWAFCYGINENYGLWAMLLQYWYDVSMYDPKESRKILEFLCCTKNKAAIKLMLRKGKDPDISEIHYLSYLQVRDHINMFSLIIAKHARNNEVLDYILSNFNILKPREFSTVAALIIMLNHVYSKPQLIQINEFVHTNLEELNVKVTQKTSKRWFQIKNLYTEYLILV